MKTHTDSDQEIPHLELMADGFERSRSYSGSSLNDTHYSSPTNYVETRIDYADEGMCRAFKDVAKLALPITITALFISALLFANLVWIVCYYVFI